MRSLLSFSALRRYPWFAPVLIACAVLTAQLLTIHLYGVTWDEPLHRSWADLFLRYWETGNREFLVSMPGNGMYYGPIYFVLNSVVAEFAIRALGLSTVAAHHLLGVIVTSVASGLLFAYVRFAFSGRVAWLALVFCLTYPQLVAHAQYNPKDIPVLVASICVFASLGMLLRTRSMFWAIATGAVLGLAIAAKLSAVSLIPVLFVAGLCCAWLEWRAGSKPLYLLHMYSGWSASIAATALVTMILFWPTLWREPSLLFEAMGFFLSESFWPGKVLYFGIEYSGSSLPWHYMFVQFFLATPLVTLCFLCIGTAVALRQFWRRSISFDALLVLLWFCIPLFLTLKPGMPRYDGIRQLLFCIPVLCILAALGLNTFVQYLRHRFHAALIACVICAVLAWNAYELLRVFPYGGSYVNEFVRLAIPQDIHNTFEVEYSGATYLQAHAWLYPRLRSGDEICVPIAQNLMTWYTWPEGVTFGCSPQSTYVVFFTRYSKQFREKFLHLTPVYAVEVYRTPLLLIYNPRGN